MKKIIHIFDEVKLTHQLILMLLFSFFIVAIFGVVYGSLELSLRLMLDPGNYNDVVNKFPIAGFVETIVGIFISAALISIVTTAFLQYGKNLKMKNIYNTLNEVFETTSYLNTRKFLKENNLEVKNRYFDLQEAEVRLEISKKDIMETIKNFGNFRLRFQKNQKRIVIESFMSNSKYGSFIDNESKITIISTQSYSDAGIGHFASSLSKSLDANYLSNEFFSSGAPLKNKQINFAKNDCYRNINKSCEIIPVDSFISDIQKTKLNTKLYIYIGTSNNLREHDVHILFGGDKGQKKDDIHNPTYSDIDKIYDFYNELKNNLMQYNLKVATHEEFANNDETHLSLSINKNLNIDVITIYISTKILWSDDDKVYYSTLLILSKAIKARLIDDKI